MSRFYQLLEVTINARKNGHSGLFTNHDLSLMMSSSNDSTFRGLLVKACRKRILKRITKAIYINPLAEPNPRTAIYRIACILRWESCNYISLESQLSHSGIISQVLLDHLTVITTGRKGLFKTEYGTVEFTHTSCRVKDIADSLYFDEEIGMLRASPEKALADLKHVGRNLNMLVEL